MKKILVIEDEKQVRLNILKILGFEGFEVIGAEDGGTGVQLAQEEMPDLILCDIMMPVLNGYDVQTELNQDPRTQSIPLVFLTAKVERDDMRLGMNLGANDYLTKPFTRDELLETVMSQLDQKALADEKIHETLHQIRDNITMSLPAEIFIPLNNIREFLAQLQQPDVDFHSAEIQSALAESYTSSQSLEKLLQNFLLYALLETTVHDPIQSAAFRGKCLTQSSDVIADIVTSKAKEYDRASDLCLILKPAKLPILEANLAKVIEELIDNAFKFSAPGSMVSVDSAQESDRFKLTIASHDQGASLEVLSLDELARPSSQPIHGRRRAGLGLAIVKRLTEIHGGELSLTRDSLHRMVVKVELPMAVGALV